MFIIILYLGCWRSLNSILTLTDTLCSDRLKKRKADKGEEINTPRSSLNSFKELQEKIHDMYAQRLKSDDTSMQANGGVSNASKYCPHEHRGGGQFESTHADMIASRLFPDVESTSSDLTDPKQVRNRIRKNYRKLRAKLNECNQHFAEVYFSSNRHAEIEPYQICAGALMKQNKSIMMKKMKDSDPRKNDVGRIALKDKLVSTMKKVFFYI